MKFAIVVSALLALASSSAFADCVCRCMDGKVQPICSSTLDVQPICAPEVCPLTPPGVEPIAPVNLPPIGTKTCRMKQVYDPYTQQYVWRRICY